MCNAGGARVWIQNRYWRRNGSPWRTSKCRECTPRTDVIGSSPYDIFGNGCEFGERGVLENVGEVWIQARIRGTNHSSWVVETNGLHYSTFYSISAAQGYRFRRKKLAATEMESGAEASGMDERPSGQVIQAWIAGYAYFFQHYCYIKCNIVGCETKRFIGGDT